MTVPQAAVDASKAAVNRLYRNQLDEPALTRDIRAALAAAAPLIAAAERERIRQLAIDKHAAVPVWHRVSDTEGRTTWEPFADLLTEGTTT